MLTIICGCRFTRLGLEALLAPLAPAFLAAEALSEPGEAAGPAPLLVVAPPGDLLRRTVVWLAPGAPRPLTLREPWRLTCAERNVLLSTLLGTPMTRLGEISGRSVKTLYSHRRSALRKLGLRKVQELLARGSGGSPVSPARCARLFTARTTHAGSRWTTL